MRLDCNWIQHNALVAIDDEDETSQTPTSSSYGSKDDGIDLENDSFDTLTVNNIVHQNLDSRISINIGVSPFRHSFVSLACPLFRLFF